MRFKIAYGDVVITVLFMSLNMSLRFILQDSSECVDVYCTEIVTEMIHVLLLESQSLCSYILKT